MAGYRHKRVGEMVLRELSSRLRSEVKDAALFDVSITRVEMNRDLSVATIFVMPLGGGSLSDEMRETLDRAARQLRGPIGRALRLRVAPELRFIADQHTEEAFRVNELLSRIEAERREHGGEE